MDLVKTMDSFVRVVRTGSFANAAEQLGVSRAIVSKHVQFLERHLSARLLYRSTRRLNLTESGQSYYDFCVRILAQLEQERVAIAGLHSEPRGTLKVMAPKSFGNVNVSSAVADFVSQYPEIHVSLLLQDGSVSSRDLIENGVDLAIRLSPIEDSSAICRQIGVSRWILCATPAYLAAHGRLESLADLSRHNCLVHLKSAPDGVWKFVGPQGKAEIKVAGSFTANSALALRAAVMKSVGLALLPIYSVSADLAAEWLVEVLPAYRGPERPIIALYPHKTLLQTKVRLLVDYLAEHFRTGTLQTGVPSITNRIDEAPTILNAVDTNASRASQAAGAHMLGPDRGAAPAPTVQVASDQKP